MRTFLFQLENTDIGYVILKYNQRGPIVITGNVWDACPKKVRGGGNGWTGCFHMVHSARLSTPNRCTGLMTTALSMGVGGGGGVGVLEWVMNGTHGTPCSTFYFNRCTGLMTTVLLVRLSTEPRVIRTVPPDVTTLQTVQTRILDTVHVMKAAPSSGPAQPIRRTPMMEHVGQRHWSRSINVKLLLPNCSLC